MLEGSDNPQARTELLRQLRAAGVPLEELREAVERDRLALPPSRRCYATGPGHALADMAADSELDVTILRRRLSALGLGQTDADATFHGDALTAAAALRELQDAGIPTRASTTSAGCQAAACCALQGHPGGFRERFSQPGDNERDLGLR